ncbi:hypothetical protein [Halanaerobaculum tunisiense]
MKKINVQALSIAFGVAWAILMLLLGILAMWNGEIKMVNLLADIYIGFKPTFVGVIIGALWGLSSGIMWGGMIGIVYNLCTD